MMANIRRRFVPKLCENFEGKPVLIESRKQFTEECKARGLDPEVCDIVPGSAKKWRDQRTRKRIHSYSNQRKRR